MKFEKIIFSPFIGVLSSDTSDIELVQLPGPPIQ